MRWLRGALIADPAIILATIFFGSISLVTSFFDSTGKAQAAVARVWAKSLLWASGVRVTVEGLEHIDPNGSYIFMSNHTSYIDTPVVLANISVQFRFLAKRGLFQIPFLGTHLSRAGHIPVPREDPRAAVKTLQLAAETVQKKKTSLLVFPEGGRSAGRRFGGIQGRRRIHRHSSGCTHGSAGSHWGHPRFALRRRRRAIGANYHAYSGAH